MRGVSYARSGRVAPLVVTGLGALGVAAIAVWLAAGSIERRPLDDVPSNAEPEPQIPDAANMATPFMTPGVRRPLAVAAGEAQLDDDTEIIGVTVAGVNRAYVVTALSSTSTHIVNDVIQDRAVSVTYCDRTDRARIFKVPDKTAPGKQTIIALSLLGWNGDQMLLQLDGESYAHDAVEIPLTDVPFERTTWEKWKAAHPQTDVFTGVPSSQEGGQQEPPGASNAQDSSKETPQ